MCALPLEEKVPGAGAKYRKRKLVSNDISYSRARALLKNLELAGAENICVLSEESANAGSCMARVF